MSVTFSLRPPEYETHSVNVSRALGVIEDRVLENGSSSQVVLATDMNNQDKKIALKKLLLVEDMAAKDKELKWACFLNEIEIAQDLHHPNIVRLEKAVCCPEALVIVMKVYPVDLFDALPHIKDADVPRYFRQITGAMHYLHQRRIVHGDLKLENVLLSSSREAVLCDFGLSQSIPEHTTSSPQWGGTSPYWGPEYVRGAAVGDVYKLESFALGVLLVALLLRIDPEPDTDYLRLLKEAESVPQPYREYAERLLHPSPPERASVTQIHELLCSQDSQE
ncbi:probable serine/threonine-protein kinase CCRP1 [Aplysia californica]|uniref:Probable serine/threonine-protein kinase CCRP1 n=1 Tax=Aplysia californica TaxID=6500 RepID=A0ABM0JE04_APLCA|nr:probable serine/threonine-protein kinase CCRP1 [Aplysia californica]